MPTASPNKHHIFISYAWADDQPFDAGKHGWVSTFVDRLRKHLGRHLPREHRGDIWLDYERLRGSDSLSASIRGEVEASRILVPIVSRSYLDSPWCREEREIFLDFHEHGSGRVFPVWMTPTVEPPAPLDDLLKYKFWYEDAQKQPVTRWFPDIDATDREYGRLQEGMARGLALRLVEICSSEPDAPEVKSAPKRSVERPVADDHLVMVNGGEEDAELVQEVADQLNKEHKISAIVPLSALPKEDKAGLKSSEITRDQRDLLKLCSAVLMVYKDGPAHQIRRQVLDFLKITPQRPKDRPAPTLGLCHPARGDLPPGLHLEWMDNFASGPDFVADSARRFAEALV